MSAPIRIVEVNSCGNCPHLDARWERAPWSCVEGGFDVSSKKRVHKDCPLPTKSEYREEKP